MAHPPSSARILLGQARRAGIDDLTARKIERWSKAGIMPSAKREGRGVGKGKGTVSRYPPGTLDQVRAIRSLLTVYRRDLDKVAVLLYLRGYHVSERALQRALANLLGAALSPILEAETPADAAEKIQARRREHVHARDRERRRAGGREEYDQALEAFARPTFGDFDPDGLERWLAHYELPAPVRAVILDAARVVSVATPDIRESLAGESPDGGLFRLLTREDLDSLARSVALLIRWLEREHGFTIQHRDRFLSDCIDALRDPRWLPKGDPQTTEEVRP